jgi:macrolide transport system ATP-binding/permease protein
MKFLRKLRALFAKEKLDAEMAEEMRAHLEHQAEENVARGMSPDEARYAAQREFGGMEQIKEQARDQRSWIWLEQLGQDVRFAWRALGRRPSFTVVAVAILALGVGANTAVFTLFNAVALRAVPVPDPGAVVRVNFTGKERRVLSPLSWPDYADYRELNRSLREVAASAPTPLLAADLGGANDTNVPSDRPMTVRGLYISENYFSLIGATFRVGRGLASEPTSEPRAEVVLSDACWRMRFAGDPAVVGRTLILNNVVFAIVGVAKADVRGTRLEPVPEVWVPLALQPQLEPQRNRLRSRTEFWLNVEGRLRPGVPLANAQAELAVVGRQLAALRAGEDLQDAILTPADYLSAKERGKIKPLVAVAMSVAAIILLIAGANLGNMLLFRTVSRQREIGVRLSLGAGRGRIFRQLATENALLVLIGGAAGLCLSVWLTAGLSVALFSPEMRAALVLRPNAPVFLYTLLVCGVVVSLFGLAPAWRAARQELATTLKNDAGGFSSPLAHARLRHALIVAQTALSLVLLVGAGLLLRTVQRGFTLETGLDLRRTLSVEFNAHGVRSDEAQAARLQQELAEWLATQPRVQGSALAGAVPLQGQRYVTDFEIEDGPGPGASHREPLSYNHVSPEFFQVLGVSLRRGRMFTADELRARQPVAVVTEALARRCWPGSDPLGRRLRIGGKGAWLEVIGTIPNTANRAAYEDEAEIYLPFDPAARRDLKMLVRAEGEVSDLPGLVTKKVKAIDARLWPAVTLLEVNVTRRLHGETTMARLSSIIGLIALGLAGAGLYGVLSWMVSQRTREIGVRMALGADRQDVRRMVVRHGLKLVALGVAIGGVVVAALSPVMKNMIYDLSPLDPLTLIVAVTLLFGAAHLACLLPARRATGVNPAVALRAE